jgi:hypothetical protein
MATNNIINIAKEAQDYAQTEAMKALKANPAAYASYVSSQKAALQNQIFDAKDRAFNKVIEDAKLASDNNNNVLYYYRRNKDLLDINTELANKAVEDVDKVVFNNGLAKRHFELNEWEVQDKRDTLFMYQIGFVSLLSIVLLTMLKKTGLLGGGLYWYLCVAIVIIFIFILLYRIIYTQMVRDKFYWSRRKFGSMNTPPASGSQCPGVFEAAVSSATNYASSGWNVLADRMETLEKYANTL